MSDTAYQIFQHYGTDAERIAFTPNPAAGIQPIYVWYATDTGITWVYDTSWHSVSGPGGSIPTLAQGDTLYASGANTLTALPKDTNATRYWSNTGASNNPAWAQVALATGVSGTLPIANGGTGVTDAPPTHLVSFTLTDAEIKALPTVATYKTLVAAPGANLALVLHWAFLYINADAGAYTNVDAGDQQGFAVAYGDWDVDCSSFYGWTGVSFASRLSPFVAIGSSDYPSINQPILGNTALKLISWNTGNFTGGNASNSGRGAVCYSVFNYTTGAWT